MSLERTCMERDNQKHKFVFSSLMEDPGEFIPIIADGDESDFKSVEVPESLPVLPLRNAVLFPGVVMPITVGRQKSLKLIRDVYAGDKLLGTVTQKDGKVEEPQTEDLFPVGTMAEILKILEMPDGTTSMIIQGKRRIKIAGITEQLPYMKALVHPYDEYEQNSEGSEFSVVIESLKDLSLKLMKYTGNVPPEAQFAIKNIESPTFLINFICNNVELETHEKQELLEENDIRSRGSQLMGFLVREVQVMELKKDIQRKVKVDLDQQQREYLLNQQIKTIQDELGGNPIEKEIEELKKRGAEMKWDEEMAGFFNKEVEKLTRMNPAAGEYSIQVGYLETLLDLPWNEYTEDNFDLHHAEKVLDDDHYGLEKVKERILEHLAVLKLKGDMKSPILCLYGPPGVGKTSLGKSIARSLGRKYIRMSLGGLHDEAEIRGHRKTYIGAMPGRIIQNLKRAGSANPVFILDEIDKVSQDFHGDPASALLEVLDPEQNSEFHDNYLDVDFDLSRVMFIATANTLSTIQPALRDRMELIDVSGYLVEEKTEIAKRHLVPRQLKNHGMAKGSLTFPKEVLVRIIENYTRESGVRELDKQLAKVVRRVARKIAFGEKYNKKLKVEDVKEYLGVPIYVRETYEGNEFAGVVTGLAWTAVGGEILYVETSLSKGKGRFTLTGNLGEVMKESATIALEYLRSHAPDLGLTSQSFEKWDVHVHVPEGAIPKDGPSAGITMATSLASAFTQRKVKRNLAMTGEITLRGKVLPVGGIKEKILAAKRAGIKEIIISRQNEKDLEEIKPIYIKGLKFHFVETVMDVLEIALLKQKVNSPLRIR
ncbi:endopeptidase La [Prolixibacter sp. SD074]|uniref:endopeptidase La n=1 Tax=Prolixibacter sp. SD074 TaxID=2652391 RepID=UPI001E5D8B69|nr:endopeptidase La [Prolixibacter sp. SD074]